MRRVLRVIGKTIKVILLLIFTVAIITLGFATYKLIPIYKQYLTEADALVASSSVSDFRRGAPTVVYASNGTEIAELTTGSEGAYTEFADLPDDVCNAFIAIEDRRFYEHHGVDWASTAKSCYLLFTTKSMSRGGSTITQQLIRNVFTSQIGFEKSYTRKAKEILTALLLEKKYSKEQILEFYVNNVNFANNCYGIGNAAEAYFDKTVDELSTSEVAFLCAIPNNPTYYNPRTNFNHTIHRRNLILKAMYEQGYLTREDYLYAVNSSVTIVAQKETQMHDYECSYAIKCATEALMRNAGFEFHYSFTSQEAYDAYKDEYDQAYEDAEHDLRSRGYQVYTTIDPAIQKNCQKILNKQLSKFKDRNKNGVFVVQGAGTVVNNSTGKVVAIIGGRLQKQTSLSWNRAWQSYMQPGSTIKPLAVYTPALEFGYKAGSKVKDEPIKDGPKNADGRYLGEITLRQAVEKSRNVIAWKLFSEVGPENGLAYLQKMQFDKITPNDYFLPAALGGLYYGVNTVQMASGYATLANLGGYQEADCIATILDAEGTSIYQEQESIQVYTKSASMQMLDILQGVAKEGTAAGLVLKDNAKMPIACKTGTTNESRCAWFCGVTPYYSVAVYVGRDDNKPIDGLYGATYPKQIWAGMQNYLCRGKTVKPLFKKTAKKAKKTKDKQDQQTVLEQNQTNQSEAHRVTPSAKEESDSQQNSEHEAEKPTKPSKPSKPADTNKPADTQQSTEDNAGTQQSTEDKTGTQSTEKQEDTEKPSLPSTELTTEGDDVVKDTEI